MLQDADEVEAMLEATADGIIELEGASTYYQVDVLDELAGPAGPGATIQTVRTVLVAKGKLPTLKVGSFPTLDGKQYRVRDLRDGSDGQEVRVSLAEIGEVR